MNELRLFDPVSLEPFEDDRRSMLRPWRRDLAESAAHATTQRADVVGSMHVAADHEMPSLIQAVFATERPAIEEVRP